MEIEGEPIFTRRNIEDTPQNLVDDDDLQAALARSRRENAKKKPKVRTEDLAAQIAQRRVEDDNTAPVEEDGRITFDDTSEFVRNVNLESRAAPVKKERAASPKQVVVKIERGEVGFEGDEAEGSGSKTARVEDGDEDMDSEDEDDALAEMAAREGLSLEEYRLKIDAQLQEMGNLKPEEPEVRGDTLNPPSHTLIVVVGSNRRSSTRFRSSQHPFSPP
jgi:U4/U6.U5 tri-snRNP-associated protein 1